MLLIMMIASWTLSVIFMFLTHPLSLGFVILLQTIIISLSSGLMNFDYWYSYILFLIMIGGMLVLFIYMTSVASNEKFKFSNKLYYLTLFSMMTMTSTIFSDNFFYMTELLNYETISQSVMYIFNMSINKFFNMPNALTMVILIFYLLVTLIAIVKITQVNMGPIRQLW